MICKHIRHREGSLRMFPDMSILIQETFNQSFRGESAAGLRPCSDALGRVRREPGSGDTGAKESVRMSRRQCPSVGEGKVEVS